eukprot:6189602-Pleurochrysis_carterae.AAC.4
MRASGAAAAFRKQRLWRVGMRIRKGVRVRKRHTQSWNHAGPHKLPRGHGAEGTCEHCTQQMTARDRASQQLRQPVRQDAADRAQRA